MIGTMSRAQHAVENSTLSESRDAAIKAKEKIYISSRPCPRGHEFPTVRITASGGCRECGRERSRDAYRSGSVKVSPNREAVLKKWNHSVKGKTAKQKWREKDPRRAWIVGVFGGAKARSLSKSLPFNITKDFLESIIPDKCPVFGTVLKFSQGYRSDGSSASLDRMIPSLGYTIGNVRIISRRANTIKSDASVEEIEAIAAWMRRVNPR